jgi:hypothetical protein
MRKRVLEGWGIEDKDKLLVGVQVLRSFNNSDHALSSVESLDRALIHYRVTIEQIKRVPLKHRREE